MKTNVRWLIFALAVVAQLAVPAWMIAERESILRTGEPVQLRTGPVDPYDAFRGRYVALRMEENSVPVESGVEWLPHTPVHVRLRVDEQGFARFVSASTERPREGLYLTARVSHASNGIAHLRLPIDRFYMEESAAPRAEAAYREHSRAGQQDAYVVVRLRRGKAIIEDLFVGGQPIADHLKAHPVKP